MAQTLISSILWGKVVYSDRTYRHHGDKLAENWIFIDLLHFWKQQDLDVLARHQSISASPRV